MENVKVTLVAARGSRNNSVMGRGIIQKEKQWAKTYFQTHKKEKKKKKGVNKENKNICITGQNEPARFDCILCDFTVNYYHIELLCVGVILMVKQQCGPEDIWLS